ncbi:MAG: PEP-CTERM system TPR-repeat protein PrsT [Burkholderiales bacterium]|nr:PEP-CTERM system TPR-repeat protein PrsT [Burkholderiales bacterium]
MKRKYQSMRLPIAILLLGTMLALGGCDKLRSYTDAEHVQRAKDFQAKGESKAAVIELKNALNKNGSNAEARWLLGEAYLDFEEGAQAEKELKRAGDLGINADTLMIPLGRAYLLQGKYGEVLAEIAPGKQASARSRAHILKLHGDAQVGLRKGKEACGLYEQAHQADTKFVDAYWGRVWCATVKGDLNSARTILEAALEIDRSNARTWVYLGDFARLERRYAEAEQAYLTALKIRPQDREAQLNLASVYLTQNKLDAASKEIEKLRKAFPRLPHPRYLEALLSYRQGKYPVARDQLQELERTEAGFPPALLLSGTVSLQLGEYEAAEKSVTVFLARQPNSTFARELLAEVQLRKGRASLALETVTPLLDRETVTARALSIAGEASVAKGDLAQATKYFERASKLQPDSAVIRTNLGTSRMRQGDVSRAEADLEAASNLDQKHTAADIALAITRLQRKDYEGAFAAIAALEKKQPSSPIPYNLRGSAYLEKRDIANARKSFEQALAIDPAFMPAAKSLAQIDMQDKKPDAARKRLQNVLAKDDNNVGAMLALADIAAAEKKEKEYLEWVEKAAKADPKALEPKSRKIDYLLSKKETQSAMALALEVKNANTGSPQAWELLGRTQLAAGEKENAIDSFTKVTQLVPESPRAYLDLGATLASVERWSDARKTFSKALTLSPDFLDARRALIVLELQQNRGAEALKLAEEQTRRQPKLPIGPIMEGDVHMAQKQFALASKAYERAFGVARAGELVIKSHHAMLRAGNANDADNRMLAWLKERPDDVGSRMYLADSLIVRTDFKGAVGHYELALQKDPDNASILNNLASVYAELKDSRALATAERAYKLQPKSAAIQDTLGWILLVQGQTARAVSLLKDAVASAPKAEVVRYHYAVALAKSGDKVKAKQELDSLLKDTKDFPGKSAAEALRKQL